MEQVGMYQNAFNGFYNTPHLFKRKVLGMTPFTDALPSSFMFRGAVKPRLRLGQLVEHFVIEELRHFENCSIMANNCQIQLDAAHTIGELDVLFLHKEKPVHLEIQFKFYLYDGSSGKSEIDCLVGPMRRDSLLHKLRKLQEKQLPLLFSEATRPLLDSLGWSSADFEQKIYFKAQIFIPYGERVRFKILNNQCIYGFYVRYDQFIRFKECLFYKPKKIDWLLDIDPAVDWLSYEAIMPLISIFQEENYSPLCWFKFPNGVFCKCFVVSW